MKTYSIVEIELNRTPGRFSSNGIGPNVGAETLPKLKETGNKILSKQNVTVSVICTVNDPVSKETLGKNLACFECYLHYHSNETIVSLEKSKTALPLPFHMLI